MAISVNSLFLIISLKGSYVFYASLWLIHTHFTHSVKEKKNTVFELLKNLTCFYVTDSV